METLSTTVSTLKVPSIHSAETPRERHLFKSPNPTHLPISSHLYNKPSSIPNRPTISSFTNSIFTSAFQSTSQLPSTTLKSAVPIIHRKATSGYAAALLDIARCNNALDAVERDVRRFLRLFKNQDLVSVLIDSSIDDKAKGGVLKEVAEKGNFQKHLVVLLKMLVEKNKVGMVKAVLEEFERFYDQLIGTRVVVVSSAKKLEEDELLGIAKRVQKMSGAAKVKVRHLINKNLPSLAV